MFLEPVKSIEIGCLSNLLPALSCAKKIDRDPKVSESPRKIDSIHQNDSIVATRACVVATKTDKGGNLYHVISFRCELHHSVTEVNETGNAIATRE